MKMFNPLVLSALLLATPLLADPLPSWNDGASEQAIIAFVESVTTEGSGDYVVPAKRIAVFDNDGTLWGEQPLYFQLLYAFDRVKAMADQHPEWATQEPFASVLKDDPEGVLAGGEAALMEMIMATHAGMTEDDFRSQVASWLAETRHPETGRLMTEMVYQPMLELLAYLRLNDFKVFIVSGGGIDFIRVFSESVYGIPPERVVGSSLTAAYQAVDGEMAVVKQPEIDLIDDKAGKPVGIHRYIGQRPIFAGGNSDGDFEMLQYTTDGKGPRFAMIVRHDDGERETAYDRDSHIGRLDRGLDEGPERGWLIVSMKNDWKTIYPD